MATTDLLPITEQAALAHWESIIARGIQTFIEVGEALAEIREARLYRAEHGTFEEYCRDRWGIGGSRARQLIGAAGVARNIESVTTVTLSSETHARPLVGLAPEQQVAAAQRATAIAGSGAPTAKHFQQAAAEVSAPTAPDLADILLRLSAHGYDRVGQPRLKGSVSYYTFRDRASDLDDDSAGVLELAEGELEFWLAELDSNATYAQQRQARYLDARDRFATLDWRLERDGKQFALYQPGGKHHGTTRQIEPMIKTLEGLERETTKKADDPAASDRQVHIAKEQRDAGRLERARNFIAAHEYDAARTVLEGVEASTWERDRLLATIPAGCRVEIELTADDCAALLKEARVFSSGDLTKKLPAIGQVLILLIEAIKS